MPPRPLPKELTQDIQTTPSPLFPSQPLTPPGPLGTTSQVPTFSGPLGIFKTPPRTLARFKEVLQREGPGLLGMAASGALPITRPLLGPLLRTGIGAGAAAGARALFGGETTPGREASQFAGSQLLAEGGFGAARSLLGQIRTGKSFRQAQADFDAATKAHTQKVENLKTTYRSGLIQHKTDVEAHKVAVAQQAREYAQKGARSIAEAYQQEVPSWREFPADERGLADMVYGKGQERLSTMYDASLKEVAQAGKGIQVPMRVEDVDALKLTTSGLVDAPGGRPTHAYVDAGDLAQKLPGQWKKNRGAYRRGFEVLDQQGLGNEAARQEYKSGQALIEFTDKSKMLAGGQFNPEAARQALYSLKTVDPLRKRGEGDVFRGPIASVAQQPVPRPPLAPVSPEKPVIPPKPTKPETDITRHEINLGHALGGVGGLMAGHTIGHPYIGFGIGAGLGGAFGPKGPFYTGGPPMAPVSPVLPSTIAELLRLYATQRQGL